MKAVNQQLEKVGIRYVRRCPVCPTIIRGGYSSHMRRHAVRGEVKLTEAEMKLSTGCAVYKDQRK